MVGTRAEAVTRSRKRSRGNVMVDPAVAAYVEWMTQRNLSAETVRSRMTVLRQLRAHAGKPLLKATRADLDAWQRQLALADSSRASYVSIVAGFYRWAVKQGLCAHDPSQWLVIPKIARRRPRPIGEEHLAAALSAADEPVRTWLLLAAYSGLRGKEIATLERGDVYDEASSPVLLVRGKGDKERIVPLTPLVLDALRPYLRTAGPLFRRADGSPADAQSVRKPCNAHLRELGIPSTLHRLRSRFATRLYALSGHNLLMVKDLLGHASPATTSIYAAWEDSEAAAAVALLDEQHGASA